MSSYVITQESGWAYPDHFEDYFGDKRHFFITGETIMTVVSHSDCVSLCGKSIRVDKLEPDRDDDHWDNCKLCLRLLNRIRRELCA